MTAAALPYPELVEVWNKLVEGVGNASLFARTYLLEAHPVSLTNTLCTIGFAPQFAEHIDLVDNPKNRALIQSKLQELGYAEAQVKFIRAEPPPGWSRPAAAPSAPAEPALTSPTTAPTREAGVEPKLAKSASSPMSKEDFKNDPLIKQALEIFKGQIVELRAQNC
jgi:hypothetical protein